MNERKVAIVADGLAAIRAEACWHACGIGNQGSPSSAWRTQVPRELWSRASGKCNDPIAGTQMLYAVLAKANSREEILANRIVVKRLGRMSDAPRASARL